MTDIPDSKKTFVYQRDDYSCGPACLATVARIYGVENKGYSFFRALLDPCPETGSRNRVLRTVAEEHLPFVSGGEDTYTGGVAIANIIHRPSGDGHYVVFLDKVGHGLIYYDPFDHEIHVKQEADIEWVSESGHLEKWSVNFMTPQTLHFDVWLAMQEEVHQQQKIIVDS